MAKLSKDVLSSAKAIKPFIMTNDLCFIRTNITLVEIPVGISDEVVKCWKFDEEVLTHEEYMQRIEDKLESQKQAHLDTLEAIAEFYEIVTEGI